MPFEIRSFLIDDEDNPLPVASSRHRRLFEGQAALPGYAGRTVRCAHFVVDGRTGFPGVLRHETYALVRFDGAGRIGADEAERWMALHVATAGLRPRAASPVFALPATAVRPRATSRAVDWRPGGELRRRLLELVLGAGRIAPRVLS